MGKAKTKTTEKPRVRYVHHYCAECIKRLESLGYILTETEDVPMLRSCALCGKTALIKPTDLYKPPPVHRKRTGAGERARAGR